MTTTMDCDRPSAVMETDETKTKTTTPPLIKGVDKITPRVKASKRQSNGYVRQETNENEKTFPQEQIYKKRKVEQESTFVFQDESPPPSFSLEDCVGTLFAGNVAAFLNFLDHARQTPNFDLHTLAANVFQLHRQGRTTLVRICGVLEDSDNNPMPSGLHWIPYLHEHLAPKNRWHRHTPVKEFSSFSF